MSLRRPSSLRDVLVHQPLAVDDRPAAAARADRASSATSRVHDSTRRSSSARRVFHARHFGQRAGAALDQAGMRGARFGRLLRSGLRRCRARRRARAAFRRARSRRRSSARSSRAIDSRASVCRASRPAISSLTRLISVADQFGALLQARLVVGGALGLALDADDRLFLAMESRRTGRRSPRWRAPSPARSRRSRRSAARAPRATRRSSRAAP